MTEKCIRDNKILYTIEDNIFTGFSSNGKILVESNFNTTKVYSHKGNLWTVAERHDFGYRLKRRCQNEWFVVDFHKQGEGEYDYKVVYPKLEGFCTYDWCGGEEGAINCLLSECKEMLTKKHLEYYVNCLWDAE